MSYSNNKRFLGRAGDWKALSPSVGHTHPLSQDSCHHRCVRPTRAGEAEGRGVDGGSCPSLHAGRADSGLGLAQPSRPVSPPHFVAEGPPDLSPSLSRWLPPPRFDPGGLTAAHLGALHLPVDHEQEDAGARGRHIRAARLLGGAGLPWRRRRGARDKFQGSGSFGKACTRRRRAGAVGGARWEAGLSRPVRLSGGRLKDTRASVDGGAGPRPSPGNMCPLRPGPAGPKGGPEAGAPTTALPAGACDWSPRPPRGGGSGRVSESPRGASSSLPRSTDAPSCFLRPSPPKSLLDKPGRDLKGP